MFEFELEFVRDCLSGLLCSAVGGAAGNGTGADLGGGGGVGQGGDGGDDDDGGDGGEGKKPQFVTADQLNKAMTGHLARAAKQSDTRLKALEAQISQLTETLAKAAAKAEDDESEGKNGRSKEPPPEWQKKIDELTQKVEKANARADAETKAREATTAANLAKEERSALKDILLDRGVTPAQAPVLAAHLHSQGRGPEDKPESQVVFRTEDGEIAFRLAGEEYGLGDGVDRFLATEAGKVWLPPREARGSGATGTGNNQQRRGRKEITLEDVGEQLEQAWNRGGR